MCFIADAESLLEGVDSEKGHQCACLSGAVAQEHMVVPGSKFSSVVTAKSLVLLLFGAEPPWA